jgi:hypothetical protein
MWFTDTRTAGIVCTAFLTAIYMFNERGGMLQLASQTVNCLAMTRISRTFVKLLTMIPSFEKLDFFLLYEGESINKVNLSIASTQPFLQLTVSANIANFIRKLRVLHVQTRSSAVLS